MTKIAKVSLLAIALSLAFSTTASAKPRKLYLEMQWITAVHEAAHVIVGKATNPDYELREVWISTRTRNPDGRLGLTWDRYDASYAKTMAGSIALAASYFAGARAEIILLGLEPTGIASDLKGANRWCQTQANVSDCLGRSLDLADAAIFDNALVIKKLAELIMNQPPDPIDGKRRVGSAEFEAEIAPLVVLPSWK